MSKGCFLIALLLCGALLSQDRKDSIDTKELKEIVHRALMYLLKKQKKAGYWPSGCEFPRTAPDPRIEEIRYRIAITSLSSLALLSFKEMDKEKIELALRKALKYLLKIIKRNHRRLRAEGSFSFAYGLRFLLRARRLKQFEEVKEEIDQAIKMLIKLTKVTQVRKGGWNYGEGFRGTISFLTATILLHLMEAKEAGFKVDEKSLKYAKRSLQRLRRKGGIYLYESSRVGADLRSSLCRSGVCELALYKADLLKKDDIEKVVRNFFKFHRYVGRSLGNNQGYFFGHYYISECMKICNPKIRKRYLPKLYRIVLRRQLKDGSWVDSRPTAGKNYGAAIGILTLANIRELLGR
jgi:hypothetical protein